MFETLLVVLLLAVLAACVLIFRKVRRVHMLLLKQRSSVREAAATYRKVEALLSIYQEFDFRGGLPPLGGWVASADFLHEVVQHIKTAKPKVVVEFGSGVSTLMIAKALKANGGGRLVSFDHDGTYAQKTRSNLKSDGVDDIVDVVHAPLIATNLNGVSYHWYDVQGLPEEPIDLVIVDGPPETTNSLARYPALPVLEPSLGKSSTLILDDTDRPDEIEMLRRWKSEYPAFHQRKRPCEKGCVVLNRDAQD